MKILNKKEIKRLYKLLENQFGTKNINLDYVFLRDKEDNVYLTNRESFNINQRKLNIKKIGVNFGKIIKGKIILSIEGAQLISSKANKNVITLNDKEIEDYMHGLNIEKGANSNIVIIKNKNNFFGSAKSSNEKIFNNIPKNRRLK